MKFSKFIRDHDLYVIGVVLLIRFTSGAQETFHVERWHF